MQCNHFSEEGNSVMFSVAKIPWINHYFTGFISFLKIQGRLYKFATYTGAKIKKLVYQDGIIEIQVQDHKYILLIQGKYNESGVLKAPKNGLMDRLISESISSDVRITLQRRNGEILFDDKGKSAGLEVVGKQMISSS